jgi:DMSO/TMAO reductase YedYZ molybdopterin-dependent catalytic subunit
MTHDVAKGLGGYYYSIEGRLSNRPMKKGVMMSKRKLVLVRLLLVGIICMAAVPTGLYASDQTPKDPAKAEIDQPGSTAPPKGASCVLSPLAMPPTPAKIPGYTELDPTTGLHVTGTMKEIDIRQYRLEVVGKVNHPLSLTYDELRCMPRTQARPTLICPGFFSDAATWAGTPLKYIVDVAGPQAGTTGVRLTAADGYSASYALHDATAPGNFLAYEWEGKALPRLHGFPVRAVFPGLEGNQWVKWVVKIEVF